MAVYLDHAATTALDARVLQAMMPYLGAVFGNASSVHSAGQEAMHAIDRSREKVAAILRCTADEVYFTSCGTESDNWALCGVAQASKRKRIVTTAIEHHAVLRTCQALADNGFDVVVVPVTQAGIVDLDALGAAIDDNTALVSVMHANNETGIVQPILQAAALAHAKGALFHTDAVQTAGVYPLDVQALGVDLLSLSAHKFYGPKGVGALYVRKGVRLANLLWGGSQEKGLRGGTYNTAAIVGLAEALSFAQSEMQADNAYTASLRDAFWQGLNDKVHSVCRMGEGESLPSVLNVRFCDVSGATLLFALDQAGVQASAGSACTAGSLVASHVLRAMGLDEGQAMQCVRFSFGKDNTMQQVQQALDAVVACLGRIRS